MTGRPLFEISTEFVERWSYCFMRGESFIRGESFSCSTRDDFRFFLLWNTREGETPIVVSSPRSSSSIASAWSEMLFVVSLSSYIIKSG